MSDTELTSSPHSQLSLAILSILGLLLIAAFAALGTWQLKRLSWKLDLIARVEERVHAAPMPVPPRNDWPNVNAARDEYRHVALQGRFLNDKETLVYAATERGAGYWVVTPLAAADGTTVLVNRGFVPTERREASTRREGQIEGEAKVTGLMRMDEPDGSLLQSNRPRGKPLVFARRGCDRCGAWPLRGRALLRRRGCQPESRRASRRRTDARRLSQQSPRLCPHLVRSRGHDGGYAGDFVEVGEEIGPGAA
ncbi:putative SUR1-like protein, similar to Bradyrhizobium japonicum shb1 gene (plasmid) [Sinorhizobium meliloti 1021]|uniref:SURF1-like protein n=1 Tax=Rhizobium meliloti (strain 1021) TaxID=266834 RepID=Q92U24_RHIME|nr:putative SUR1-like protein, similar to Bradyrhizobium japonicum shb1 gene [Sinorhizobium meliloti 1021]